MEKLWAAIAPQGLEGELHRELAWRGISPLQAKEQFFLFSGEPIDLWWTQSIWKDVKRLPITSIGDGVKKLRALAPKWRLFSADHHRRAALIMESLRKPKQPLLHFPEKWKEEESGLFTLWQKEEVLYSHGGMGEVFFAESKEPPSRAYLKLWEALARLNTWPSEGEHCLEIGASPGGWTWVISRLQADVLAIDRSPLEQRILAMPGVSFQKGDAFAATPEKVGAIDWLFSDVICYPEKLYEYVQGWIQSGKAKQFVCTLKFQGDCDFNTIQKFSEIGRVVHLFHNKHELTFFWEEKIDCLE